MENFDQKHYSDPHRRQLVAENRLMILHEKLAIGVKSERLHDEGKHEEATELAKTKQMPAYMANIPMKKIICGKAFQ